MPEKTEFEEKEYEQPLNHQLLLASNNLWSPGQVFEKIFGVDAAITASDFYFWSLFGKKIIPSGISLRTYSWNWLWKAMATVKKFPSFKINLLIQAKRPSYRYGINANYSANGITRDYWQFTTTFHQQKILEKLEKKLANNVLVIYACAAFHKFDDLDNHIQNGSIVKNSTFVKPSDLKGHKKWVYDQPGTKGLCCSEIKKHSDKEFMQQLENLISFANESTNENIEDLNRFNSENLFYLDKISVEICMELENNSIAIAYLRRRLILSRIIDESLRNNNNREYIRSFLSFNLFTDVLNITWYCVGGN